MIKRVTNLFVWLTALMCILNSCKKNSNGPASPNYNDSTQFNQTVIIKIIATKPSPSDSVNTPLADSVIINQVVAKGQDAMGVNLYIGAANQPNNYTYPGFGFSYYYDGVYPLGRPLLLIDQNSIPPVTPGFLLNTTYSNTSITNYLLSPLYLSMQGVTCCSGLYFTGAIPTDATDTASSDTAYCQVVFTNKFTSVLNNDTIRYASGVISGYESWRYGKFSATEYVKRWDFSVHFQNLAYNIN